MRVLAFLIALLAVLPGRALAGEFGVHGYLTQAYAASDGHQVLGINREGTTAYRNLAIQLRYAPSPRSAFAMQLQNQRLGDSPAAKGQNDIELNWAYMSDRVGEYSEFKLGKTRLPLGIYNEVRSVGSVLPFYRVPYSIYREATWTPEAIEGVVFSTGTPPAAEWRLTSDLFYGGWDMVEPSGATTDRSRAEKALGAQLWIYTPVENLRFGLAGQRAHVNPGSPTSVISGGVNFYLASVDAHPGRFIAQSEWLRANFGDNAYWAAYGHLGLELTQALTVHAELDHARLRMSFLTPYGPMTADRDYVHDLVAGLTYGVGYDVLLKAETHWSRGFDIEDNPPDLVSGQPARTRYFILSASASF